MKATMLPVNKFMKFRAFPDENDLGMANPWMRGPACLH